MALRHHTLDKLGTLASGLCAVHCVLSGLALGVLSAVGLGVLASGPVEIGFIVATVGIGAAAVVSGFLKHRKLWPGMMFLSGILAVLIRHFLFHGGHEGHSHGADGWWLSVTGGLLLISFHVVNMRLSHRATCGCCGNTLSHGRL